MENFFGMKELYDCFIKATYRIEMNSKIIEPGEIIGKFDRIQISGLQEFKKVVQAKGGVNNSSLVFWETNQEVGLVFDQGVFSKKQFAIMNNCKLLNIVSNSENILLTKEEEAESDENNQLTLLETPVSNLFIYNKENGNKVNYSINNREVTLQEVPPFTEVLINYEYNYVNGGSVFNIGQKLINGFVSFEGKTRLKDDNTGHTITGIIKIPKLKLMSNLSITLGKQANPVVSHFTAVGYPVGDRHNSYVCQIYSLNNDIDSNI